MWDEERHARFQALRTANRQGSLSEADRAELAGLIRELEDEEAAYLRPASQRLEEEARQLEAHTAPLREILKREKRLAARLERELSAAQKEQDSLRDEKAQIVAAGKALRTSRR